MATLVAAKKSVQAIAIELGRTDAAIRARLAKLNLVYPSLERNSTRHALAQRSWRGKFGIGTLAGLAVVLGFVFEEYNKTFPAADAKGDFDEVHPFNNTLNIKNPSAIFDMHNVKVNCEFAAVATIGLKWHGKDLHTYQTPIITAREPFVFISDVASSFYFVHEGDSKSIPLKQGLIVVNLSYETWFGFGNFAIHWSREQPIYLNFVQNPAPHWISGEKIL